MPAAQPSLARWIASLIDFDSRAPAVIAAASSAVKRSSSQLISVIDWSAAKRASSAGGGVRGVGLKPDTIQFARNDVAADERRFARARRTGDPRNGMRAQRVDPREQPLALQYVVEPRTTELGKRDRRRF